MYRNNINSIKFVTATVIICTIKKSIVLIICIKINKQNQLKNQHEQMRPDETFNLTNHFITIG